MAFYKDDAAIYFPPNKINVCFGYTTALEILRSIDPSKLVPATKRNLASLCGTPQKPILIESIKQAEMLYPTLKIRRPFHVLVNDADQCRKSNVCTSHLYRSIPPNGSLKQLNDSILVSSVPFAFIQIASLEKNLAELLQLGFELCGTYRTKKTSTEPAYQVQPLTTTRELRNFVTHNPNIRGVRKVRTALQYIADGSASPRETKLALMLGLPMSYGGYGLGIPYMNYKIETDTDAKVISGRSHLLCDLCWPEAKLDVEYQSREMHEGEYHRIRDSRRTNALASMGWNIVNISNDELDSMYATDAIADMIRGYLGKRKRTNPSNNYHRKKFNLRRQLGLVIGYE